MSEREVPADLLRGLGIGPGVTLVQHPVSPFCLAVQRLLEGCAAWDSACSCVERSPAVVVYEARDDGQDVARYVDQKYSLGVFPAHLAGLHELLVQYAEGQVEDTGFRLNDAYFLPSLPDVVERTMYVRHKERKFGRGCVQQWLEQAPQLRTRLAELLAPLEEMLSRGPFLLGRQPVYADYALHGVLGNYTYSAQNRLPEGLTRLARWYDTLPGVRLPHRPD